MEKTTKCGALLSVLLTNHSDDQIKKHEMGGARGTYRGQESRIHFWCGNVKERDHLQDLDKDGGIILKWIFKKWDGEVWTGL